MIAHDQAALLVITSEHAIRGTHRGSVRVASGGNLELHGTLQGTLDVQSGATVLISGSQQGTVSIATGASVRVTGAIQGTTSLDRGASVIVEPSGKLAGTLANDGIVIVRGVFGGAQSGEGTIRLEGNGYIKQPTSVKGGIQYYQW